MRRRIAFLLVAPFVVSAGAIRAQTPTTLTTQDYIDIQQLYARYNMAHDSSDAKLLEAVFTPDGEFVSGGNRRSGRGMIAATAVKKERPQVRHMATSITIAPSPEGARGTSYVMLVNGQATPPAISGTGFYEDVIVKTSEGWRFKTRNYFPQSAPAAAQAGPQSSTR